MVLHRPVELARIIGKLPTVYGGVVNEGESAQLDAAGN